MFVIEKTRSPLITSLAQACSVSGVPVLLWEPRLVCSKEMVKTLNPSCVIISRESYINYGDELLDACDKPLVMVSTYNSIVKDRFIKVQAEYCVNPIINTSVKEMDSYKTRFSIINDCNIPKLVLHNIIQILNNFDVSNYRIYGPRVIDSPHFVGNIDQTSYGFVYKNSNIIDYNGEHYGNAEIHGNTSIDYQDLYDSLLDGIKSNSVDLSKNCFNLMKEILDVTGLTEYKAAISTAQENYSWAS